LRPLCPLGKVKFDSGNIARSDLRPVSRGDSYMNRFDPPHYNSILWENGQYRTSQDVRGSTTPSWQGRRWRSPVASLWLLARVRHRAMTRATGETSLSPNPFDHGRACPSEPAPPPARQGVAFLLPLTPWPPSAVGLHRRVYATLGTRIRG
jgi:hypothetical protein